MPEPRDEQPDLVGLTEPGDVAHRGPELGGGHVELLEGAAQVGHDPMHDALQPFVPAGLVQPGGTVQQQLHLGGVGQGVSHFFLHPGRGR